MLSHLSAAAVAAPLAANAAAAADTTVEDVCPPRNGCDQQQQKPLSVKPGSGLLLGVGAVPEKVPKQPPQFLQYTKFVDISAGPVHSSPQYRVSGSPTHAPSRCRVGIRGFHSSTSQLSLSTMSGNAWWFH